MNLHNDLKVFGSFGITCGSDNKLPATASFIFQILNNYKLGFSFTRDLKAQGSFKPEKINATFTGQLNSDLNVFARFDPLKNHVESGGNYLVKDFIDKVGWFYFFDLQNGNLANHHLGSVIEKKYNDDTTFRTRIESKDKVLVTNAVHLKVTPNFKVKLVD